MDNIRVLGAHLRATHSCRRCGVCDKTLPCARMQVRKKLKALKLDNEPVWDRERLREKDPDRAKVRILGPWHAGFATSPA